MWGAGWGVGLKAHENKGQVYPIRVCGGGGEPFIMLQCSESFLALPCPQGVGMGKVPSALLTSWRLARVDGVEVLPTS